MGIQADLIYSHTGYDVTNYLQSEVVAKKPYKIPLRPAPFAIIA